MPKILIVEDDPFLQKMYRKKFELAGFTMEVAGDGEEGLAKMRLFKPDLVVMDIMMPKLNGIDAVAQAKADTDLTSIPILVLTNLSSTEDAKLAVSNGAVGYLVKSDYTPAQVITKVKEVLKIK